MRRSISYGFTSVYWSYRVWQPSLEMAIDECVTRPYMDFPFARTAGHPYVSPVDSWARNAK